MALTAEEIIRLLRLEPLSHEGGFFAENYRSGHLLAPSALPSPLGESRHLCTAIYYLLTPEANSRLHRLKGDEVYHFYMGDAVELLTLPPGGTGEVHLLGTDLSAGQRPQVVVPGGVWQGSRLLKGGRLALMGTTMAPGFDFGDWEAGDGATLAYAYSAFADLIRALG